MVEKKSTKKTATEKPKKTASKGEAKKPAAKRPPKKTASDKPKKPAKKSPSYKGPAKLESWVKKVKAYQAKNGGTYKDALIALGKGTKRGTPKYCKTGKVLVGGKCLSFCEPTKKGIARVRNPDTNRCKKLPALAAREMMILSPKMQKRIKRITKA